MVMRANETKRNEWCDESHPTRTVNCLCEQDLHLLLDNEYPLERLQDAHAHLRQCPACEARLAELRMIGDIVRNAPLPTPAKAAIERWQRSFAHVQEQQVRRLASWMTAAASIVLAVSLYSAMSHQAVAAPPQLAEWEAAVIGIDSSAPDEQATAQWISTDLSRQQRAGSNNP